MQRFNALVGEMEDLIKKEQNELKKMEEERRVLIETLDDKERVLQN